MLNRRERIRNFIRKVKFKRHISSSSTGPQYWSFHREKQRKELKKEIKCADYTLFALLNLKLTSSLLSSMSWLMADVFICLTKQFYWFLFHSNLILALKTSTIRFHAKPVNLGTLVLPNAWQSFTTLYNHNWIIITTRLRNIIPCIFCSSWTGGFSRRHINRKGSTLHTWHKQVIQRDGNFLGGNYQDLLAFRQYCISRLLK